MNRIAKFAAAATLTGALTAATAANAGYFGPDYPNEPGYGYAPGYAYAPAPGYQAYAYEPGSAPLYRGPVSGGQCWISTNNSRAFGYYGSCASDNEDLDADTLGQARPNKSFTRP